MKTLILNEKPETILLKMTFLFFESFFGQNNLQ